MYIVIYGIIHSCLLFFVVLSGAKHFYKLSMCSSSLFVEQLYTFLNTHIHTHTYTYIHTHIQHRETHPKVETLQVLNHNFKLMILEKEKPNKATNQGLHRCVASLSWLHFLGAPLRVTLSVSTHPYMGMSPSYGHFCSLQRKFVSKTRKCDLYRNLSLCAEFNCANRLAKIEQLCVK